MILTRDNRIYTCTTCRLTKGICLQALHRIETLSREVERRRPLLWAGFEREGRARFDGCGRPCTAVYRVTPDDLHIFCDVDPGESTADLLRYADALLSGSETAAADLADLVRRGVVPSALVISARETSPGATSRG